MQSKKPTDLQGIDISSLQSISNETLLFSKIKFLYVRAYGSDHTGTGDSAAAGFVTTARAHNCPVGAYYFATPFIDAAAGISTDPQIISHAQTQAQQFIDKLHTIFGAGNVGDLFPVVDLEQYTDKTTQYGHTATNNAYYPQASGMTAAQLVTFVKAFRDYFFTNTGRRLGFYTNSYWLTTGYNTITNGQHEGMGLTTAQISDINNNNTMPLWIAQYDQWYGGDTGNVSVADLGNWTVWNAWQYSGTAPASDWGVYHAQNQVDLDRASDLSWLIPPSPVPSWGLTDNLDGTLTITMTHPSDVDYIGTSVYLDNVWKKWIAKTSTSVTLTGLTIGQTYSLKLVTEDNNHDITTSDVKTITMASPPPPPVTTDPNAPPPVAPPLEQNPINQVGTTDYTGTIDLIQYPAIPQTRSFTINGLDSRNFGFLINKITRPFLPPTTVPIVAIPNRPGAIGLKRNEFGVRNIKVDISLLGDNFPDLREKVRNLAGFLIYPNDVPIIFSDEPDVLYMGRLNTTSTDLNEMAEMGEGSLIFTCFDPLAYSITEKSDVLTGTSKVFHNAGSVACFPRIEIVPTGTNTFIKFTNTTVNKSITYNAAWTAGDKLIIDCKKNSVYRDSDKVSFIKNITLDSLFFPLVPGDNTITVANQDVNGVGVAGLATVYWTECYY